MNKFLNILASIFFLLWGSSLLAQEVAMVPAMAGAWVVNERQSDSTDKKVEAALKAMGQKVKRSWFSRDKEQFRGGPAEHELYDRISYDHNLHIQLDGETYFFTYDQEYERPVYTDGRRRSVSLNALEQVDDFSFGHWENGSLLVEGRPRDGGFSEESYSLVNNGTQLQARLLIRPRSFSVPIELTRIYDRRP